MSAESATLARAGKYLSFRLMAEEYGLEILKVQEIIGLLPITHIPKLPNFMRGVINLRGRLIPVIDMRTKMGLPVTEPTEKTCIIVVEIHFEAKIAIGILVDSVSEVLNIQTNQIDAAPSVGGANDCDFLLGMGKVGNKVVMLLDIDQILTAKEAQMVSGLKKETLKQIV